MLSGIKNVSSFLPCILFYFIPKTKLYPISNFIVATHINLCREKCYTVMLASCLRKTHIGQAFDMICVLLATCY